MVLVLGAASALAFLAFRDSGPSPRGAAEAYARAWSGGADGAAASLTNHPRAAAAALRESRRGLDGARVRVSLAGAIDEDGDRATAHYRVTWAVPRIGPLQYRTTAQLVKRDNRWVVHWSPRLVHPRLTARTRLGTSMDAASRGKIYARDGRAIVAPRDVVDLGVEVARVKDAAATASAFAGLEDVDVDAAQLARRIDAAPKGGFIPVITVRRAVYEDMAERVLAIPGASVNLRKADLPPTKTFARALLGTVGPPTAEQIEKSPSRRPDDEMGQSGLQASYERRLAGTPARRIVIRDRELGSAKSVVLERRGRPGRGLHTTLDIAAQSAAEVALGDVDGNAALVAVQPSTGDVLAVANRPADSAYDRALSGLYPPGSTFKVVATTALLRAGLDVNRVVDCPRTLTIEGKPFRNFEGDAAGAVPFRRDFAESCNTAFVSLARELDPKALTAVARDFGLGGKSDPHLPAADTSVPPPTSGVGQAAMMIGQDRILASPLAMACVAATVAAGRWHAPRLILDTNPSAGPRLAERETLRSLMRDVVTSGTGTALRGVRGEVIGKSGTAEFGGGDPPPTHAWFIAARDDLAISVLVENGRSGGTVAAPIAARFFTALDGSA